MSRRATMALEVVAVLAALAIVIATLQGCSSLKIPDKVSTATAVACIDDDMRLELERACPQLRTDAEILGLDDFKVVQALRADRGRAAECIDKQRAAVAACAKVPAAAPSSSSSGDGRRE